MSKTKRAKAKPSPKSKPALVFVCSGAADVGELTDRAARKLHADGLAAMSCQASVGARDAVCSRGIMVYVLRLKCG